MLAKFLGYSQREGLFTGRGIILAAVSGGVDSMVMAHLLAVAGISHAIAHCNFLLRGAESDGDEQFVAQWAAKIGIPFHSIRFDTAAYARDRGLSLQMAARELRYDWFGRLLASEGYEAVAVAHNRDDNAETFLVNLLRGTGLSGLTGMRPRTGNIIRPLLFASRREIAAYALQNSLAYREDSSNAQLKYARNRIRHKVIPEMEKVSGDALTAISGTIEHLSKSALLLEKCMEELRDTLFTVDGETVTVPLSGLLALAPAEAYLFELFRPWGLSSRQLPGLIALLHSSTGRSLYTATHRLLNDRGRLIITPFMPEEQPEQLFGSVDEMRASPLFSEVTVTGRQEEHRDDSRMSASLDLDRITFPVTVRRWRKGERFMPLGMRQMKKISDFLTDMKVPLAVKERVTLLVSGGEVAWVMGYRIDERFRIMSATTRVLKLTLKERQG